MADAGLFVGSGALVGAGIMVAYATVLFDAFGGYALPQPRTGYLDSPYWVGIPKSAVYAIVVLQVFAAVGYVTWMVYVASNAPTRGILADRGRMWANLLFLVPSAVWPYAAHRSVLQPHSVAWAVGASVPLWIAAAGVILLVAGTFEAQYASPVPYLGILFLALVVVLADGVGWAAAAIFRAVHDKP